MISRKSNSMSITFKFILDQRRPIADSTFPIRLRIYDITDYKEVTLGVNIKPDDWDDVEQGCKGF